ncbi:MAG TPA: type III polyketide synthase [Puia sp.]|nr:type III polyketide synthase [Puia sp.]
MSKIISIGTALPSFIHKQSDILYFMQHIYAMNESDKRKLKFIYSKSGIEKRYSVVPDYSRGINDWKFYPRSENLEPFPSLEQRMIWYNKYAAPLSVDAIRNCIKNKIHHNEITHLITVSCTGMSAPGLDLQVMELMDLHKSIFRTSVNFMGCYAAIHALKLADAICRAEPDSNVLIVCTELCTLHFQREPTMDNIASSLLFSDGSAAILVTSGKNAAKGLQIKNFYSEVLPKGKKDMAWELSSTGFLMTLSGYIPNLIEEDFEMMTRKAFEKNNLRKENITHWCVHPGGKKILEAIRKSMQLTNGELDDSYCILKEYGNMSSPTILFVLKKILDGIEYKENNTIFAAAFGPGLTMETFTATA